MNWLREMKPIAFPQPVSTDRLMDVVGWLHFAKTELAEVSDSASLDAQVLLADRMAQPRSWLLAHGEARVPESILNQLDLDLNELSSDVPLPYLLGRWPFYGRDFIVSPDVLIPRPETEGLIELALTGLQERRTDCRVIDVGAGSGCIAVTLALELPKLRVTASEISSQALLVARRNATQLEAANLRFIQGDLLLAALQELEPHDLIIANLPYIPTAELHALAVSRREPILALDGGFDGLRLIEKLLVQSKALLTQGGFVLIEIDSRRGQPALALAETTWPNAQCQLLPDLAGRDLYIRIETNAN